MNPLSSGTLLILKANAILSTNFFALVTEGFKDDKGKCYNFYKLEGKIWGPYPTSNIKNAFEII